MRPWGRICGMPGPHISIIFVDFRGVQRLAIACLEAGAEPLEGTDIPLEFLHRHRAAGAEAGKKRLSGDTERQATSGEVKDLRREMGDLKEALADVLLENRLLKKSMIEDGGDHE